MSRRRCGQLDDLVDGHMMMLLLQPQLVHLLQLQLLLVLQQVHLTRQQHLVVLAHMAERIGVRRILDDHRCLGGVFKRRRQRVVELHAELWEDRRKSDQWSLLELLSLRWACKGELTLSNKKKTPHI